MSFRCEQCNEVQPIYSRPNRIVVDARRKQYIQEETEDQPEKVTYGWEIVKELDVCELCFGIYKAKDTLTTILKSVGVGV